MVSGRRCSRQKCSTRPRVALAAVFTVSVSRRECYRWTGPEAQRGALLLRNGSCMVGTRATLASTPGVSSTSLRNSLSHAHPGEHACVCWAHRTGQRLHHLPVFSCTGGVSRQNGTSSVFAYQF